MVGQLANQTPVFLAAEGARVLAAPDGGLAAIVEPRRIVVVELAQVAPVAEIGLDGGPDETDVLWVGPPARLLVLTRGPEHSTVHLVDPIAGGAPQSVAQIRIESSMRMRASVGTYALAIGARNAAVLSTGDTYITPYQFPARGLPLAAGAAAKQFVVAVAGAIEEWDPQQRIPKRRMRLPRAAAITALGGTERLVWVTTQQEPSRVDVIPLINTGQPRAHELPEPIAEVSGHPQRDLLVCRGAASGRLYLLDLEGRMPGAVLDPPGLDRVDAAALFTGRASGVIAARAGQPLALLGLDGRALEPGAGGRTAEIGHVALGTPRAATGGDDEAADDDHATGLDDDATYDPALGPDEIPDDDEAIAAAAAAAPADGTAGAAAHGTAAHPATAAHLGATAPGTAAHGTAAHGTAAPAGTAAHGTAAHGTAAPAGTATHPGGWTSAPTAAPAAAPAANRWSSSPDRPIVRALGALAPRGAQARCTPGQYHGLLDHYRRYTAAIALRAIAQDWDSGRLAFSTQDRPPFEAEVLGIAGRRRGLAARQVTEATEALDEVAAALQNAKRALTGRASPLDALCTEHGVSKLGELVLLHVAAPTLWGELARLYGILSNDPGRPLVDEHLVWQLLGHLTNRRDLGRELDPDAPLIAHGLIRAGEGRPRPFQSLTVDPVVAKQLAGAIIEPGTEPGMAAVPATVTLEEFRAPREVTDRALGDLAGAPPGRARVVVRGRIGSGRRTLLATLADLAGRTLTTIDAGMLVREKRIPTLRSLLQHAHLGGWLPCVDGLDTIASDDTVGRSQVREILRDHHGPLAVRLPRHAQPPLEPGYVMIDLPDATIAERAVMWRDALAPHRLEVKDPDELAARFNVGPGVIHHIAETVARIAPTSVDAAIESSMRQHLETRLGTVATRVTRLATWAQIVLPADIRDSIVELVARVRHRRRVYDTWGFDQVITSARGLTALFQGGPGTGKTLVASAIANDLGLDLYRIDLSRVMSKWIGETEQNLAKVFDAAEEGQALILFDEADSLFAKRTEVRTSVDRYANLEVNYLLQRFDTFEGVAILTTNFGTAIDAAFKRRLSCRLTFPFPDDEARERLWRVHLPERMPRAGKLDLASLARRYRMSGGYIRNAALRAAFLAAEEGAVLSQDHLERAVSAEFREGGKLAESGTLE